MSEDNRGLTGVPGLKPGSAPPMKEKRWYIVHTYSGQEARARQALLEIQAYDPSYQDVAAKLEALTDVVPAHGRPDERVVTLVEVDAPLGTTIFDVIRGLDLGI